MAFEGSTLDLVVHILTFTAAVAVFGVSTNAYRRKGSSRFLLVCAAFGVFALKEAVMVVNMVYLDLQLLTAVTHALNLVLIALFFSGVVR